MLKDLIHFMIFKSSSYEIRIWNKYQSRLTNNNFISSLRPAVSSYILEFQNLEKINTKYKINEIS